MPIASASSNPTLYFRCSYFCTSLRNSVHGLTTPSPSNLALLPKVPPSLFCFSSSKPSQAKPTLLVPLLPRSTMAFVPPTALARSPFLSSPSLTPLRRPLASSKSSRFRPLNMIAVEPAISTELSSTAIGLLSYLRGHKSIFQAGKGFNSTHATLFRKNDTGRLFTPLDELATNAHLLPGGSVSALIVVEEVDIVRQASDAAKQRAGVKLPDVVMEVLEFDMRYMLRVISYGVACQSTDFIHRNNWGIMKMLHEEVGISTYADVAGLKKAKEVVLAQITEPNLVETTAACFDVVIDFMS